MKLRIKGNSIRLRLTKTEVGRLKDGLAVAESLSFSAGVCLVYSLDSSSLISGMQTSFDGKNLNVRVEESLLKQWAWSDEISLQGEYSVNENERVSVLIEKDFFCLKPRTQQIEDESDMFVNPNESHGSCG